MTEDQLLEIENLEAQRKECEEVIKFAEQIEKLKKTQGFKALIKDLESEQKRCAQMMLNPREDLKAFGTTGVTSVAWFEDYIDTIQLRKTQVQEQIFKIEEAIDEIRTSELEEDKTI